MSMRAAALLVLVIELVAGGQCPAYEDISTKTAKYLNPEQYQGYWYEVASANVILTKGCECTRYHFQLATNTTFDDTFTCHKGSPDGKLTTLPNHGSFDPTIPGKMVESLGPVSPPYWVLNIWDGPAGAYSYALVYACVDLLVTKSEYIYMFSRNASIPAQQRAIMNAYATAQNISLANVQEVPMQGCSW